MNKRETSEAISFPTDPSLEFDFFEVVRASLAGVLSRKGYTAIEAERIALYMVQAMQHVPKLLKLLASVRPVSSDEIIEVLGEVLDEAPALEKARRLLLHQPESQE
jgi:hypothetical protein